MKTKTVFRRLLTVCAALLCLFTMSSTNANASFFAAICDDLACSGGNDFIGGFSRAFLEGLTTDARVSTYTAGNTIPELNFVIFQGCVAAITSVLVVSVLGRRMRFAALICCLPLWATLVYFPLAHMAWYWPGADATSDAAKALAAADTDAAKAAAPFYAPKLATVAAQVETGVSAEFAAFVRRIQESNRGLPLVKHRRR